MSNIIEGAITYNGNVNISVCKNNNVVKKFNIHNSGNIPLFKSLVFFLADTPIKDSTPKFIDIVNSQGVSCLKQRVTISAKQTLYLQDRPTLYLRSVVVSDIIKLFGEVKKVRLFAKPNDKYDDYLAEIDLSQEVISSFQTAQGVNYSFVVEWEIFFNNNISQERT